MRNIGIILLIGVIAVALGLMIYERENGATEYGIDSSRAVAQEWMENVSPTYTFDGTDLELVSERELDDGRFEYTFDFQSASAGFGDRTDEMTAQVITDHTTVVTVSDGEVVSAVTDGVYSEIDDEILDGVSNDDPEPSVVSVYFVTVEDGQESAVSVERVSPDEDVEVFALRELFAGPTEEESDTGYSTAINEGVEILSFSVEDRTAEVDLSSELGEGVAGSAMVMMIREQIERTLEQFESIDNVVIMIEGESEGILQP